MKARNDLVKKWKIDFAPIRTLGALLALISGFGAIFDSHVPWLASGTFVGVGSRVVTAIGVAEIALALSTIPFPRIGALAATGFYCGQRVYQNMQTAQPILLVAVAWLGLCLIASLEAIEVKPPQVVVGKKTRRMIFLFSDGLLLWGVIHAAILGACMILQTFWNIAPNIWIQMPTQIAMLVGISLIVLSAMAYYSGTARGYYIVSMFGYLMRWAQGAQVHNLYIILLWTSMCLVAWWAYRLTSGWEGERLCRSRRESST